MSIMAPRSPYEEAWQQWNYGGGGRRGEPPPDPSKFRRPREAPEKHPGKEELAYKKRWPNDIQFPVGPSPWQGEDGRGPMPGGKGPGWFGDWIKTQFPDWNNPKYDKYKNNNTIPFGPGRQTPPFSNRPRIPFGNTSPRSPFQDMGRFQQPMRNPRKPPFMGPIGGGMIGGGGFGVSPSMGMLGGLFGNMFRRQRQTPEQFNAQVSPFSLTRMQPNGTIAY